MSVGEIGVWECKKKDLDSQQRKLNCWWANLSLHLMGMWFPTLYVLCLLFFQVYRYSCSLYVYLCALGYVYFCAVYILLSNYCSSVVLKKLHLFYAIQCKLWFWKFYCFMIFSQTTKFLGVHNALAIVEKSLQYCALTSTVSHFFVAEEFFNLWVLRKKKRCQAVDRSVNYINCKKELSVLIMPRV